MATDVLLFDSGVGARAVEAALKLRAPHLATICIADREGFPYGARTAPDIAGRTRAMIEAGIRDHAPKAVIVACNTASVCIAAEVDSWASVPVHLTYPPLMDAARLTRSRHIAVLATPVTTAHPVFAAQLTRLAAYGVKATLVPCPGLADMAESFVRDNALPDLDNLRAMLAPAVENPRVDTLVLGCTHYSFLRHYIEGVVNRPLFIADSSESTASRYLLGAFSGESTIFSGLSA